MINASAATAATRSNAGFEPAKPERVPIRSRPLAPLAVAMCLLDMSAERVRTLLDDGRLTSFNIATERTGKACQRILLASVDSYLQTRKNPFAVLPWPEIFKLVWPFHQPNIKGTELARCLNCDRGHVENLINAKLFHVVKKAAPGPEGSPIVTVASFEAFLKGRLQ